MKYPCFRLLALTGIGLLIFACCALGDDATSQWVHPDPDGKLVYKTTPAGDRIMDFSYAGYMGGGVALPMVPVVRTVAPGGPNDGTAAIQAAIDEVSTTVFAARFFSRPEPTVAPSQSTSPPAASFFAAVGLTVLPKVRFCSRAIRTWPSLCICRLLYEAVLPLNERARQVWQ